MSTSISIPAAPPSATPYQLYMGSAPSTPTSLSHDALISMLLTKSATITHNKLWSFLKKLKVSRSVQEIGNFADGYLVAEIIHLYAPLLITFVDLPMVDAAHKEQPNDRRIWHFLALTALKQLCIQLTQETVQGFESADAAIISDFFILLFQQIDQHARVYKVFSSRTRQVIHDNYDMLTSTRSTPGSTTFHANNWRTWVQGGRTVIRLSNVDYQTTKADVQRFLYPLVVHQDAIHIPVHLSSGKMMYTIYVVFDDTVVPLRAVDLHSGHTLRSRRVEIKLVTHDDLFQAFFSRPITPGAPGQQQQQTSNGAAMAGPEANGVGTGGEWVTEEAKERMLKLCSTGKNCFSAKTPERPFEHVQSCLALVPWDQPQVILSSVELGRLFDVACGVSTALLTFLNHDGFRDKFSAGLLRRLVQAGLSVPFNDEQHQFLQSIYEANLKGAHEFLANILQTRAIPAPISPTFTSSPPAAASGYGSLVASSPSPPPQQSNSVNMYHAQQMQQFPHPLSHHVLMGTMGQYASSPVGYSDISSPSTPSALATEFVSYQEGFNKTMLPSRDSGVFDYAFGQFHESQQQHMNPYQLDTSGAGATQGPAWAVISGYSGHLQRQQSTSPPLSSYETSPTSPSATGPISHPPPSFSLGSAPIGTNSASSRESRAPGGTDLFSRRMAAKLANANPSNNPLSISIPKPAAPTVPEGTRSPSPPDMYAPIPNHVGPNGLPSANPLSRPYMSALEQAFYAATPMSASFPRSASASSTTSSNGGAGMAAAVGLPLSPMSMSPPSAVASGLTSAMSPEMAPGELEMMAGGGGQEGGMGPEHVLGRGLWEAL